MSRTKTILLQEGLLFTSGWVECRAEDLEHALERFMLVLSEEDFRGLLESLWRQREAQGGKGGRGNGDA